MNADIVSGSSACSPSRARHLVLETETWPEISAQQVLAVWHTGVNCTGLDWTGLEMTWMDWTGLGWTGLYWRWLEWTGLNCTGLEITWNLEWIRLDKSSDEFRTLAKLGSSAKNHALLACKLRVVFHTIAEFCQRSKLVAAQHLADNSNFDICRCHSLSLLFHFGVHIIMLTTFVEAGSVRITLKMYCHATAYSNHLPNDQSWRRTQ